ncbi:MAG: isocitrate lyase/phosphoenolpyruvate mutase family protein [Candidatus Acidiferrales bacterium]
MTTSEQLTQNSLEDDSKRAENQRRKAEEFFSLHIRGNPVVLFNVWDVGSARAVAAGGAKAIATSSWSVANANGFTDGERIPLNLAINILRGIVRAVNIPVTADLESGYGDAPEIVGGTIRLAIEAGAVGCNLEDSFPANGKLRELGDQVDRIRRARSVADGAKARFLINARTDIFFQRPAEQHDDAMVDEAVERTRAYAGAGADGVFAPGLVDMRLIARLANTSPLPLNVMMMDAAPPLKALAEHGVARVSYGPQPYLLAMKALEEAARRTAVVPMMAI